MTATELLRNAREKLLDFCVSIPSSDPRSVALLEFVLEIDAFLSQPEPAMSAEVVRETCAKWCESYQGRTGQDYAKHIRSLDLSRKEKA